VRTLLDERFAPITSSIGFLRASLAQTAAVFEEWRRQLYPAGVRVENVSGQLADLFPLLEPLTTRVRPRELLVEVAGGWTAYFDCRFHGTDPQGFAAVLSSRTGAPGVTVTAVPDRWAQNGPLGAVQFEWHDPASVPGDMRDRSISISNEGPRWRFDVHGPVQPFEEVERYGARRLRDRFTTDMLERYCSALGFDVFNAAAYGPRGVWFRSQVRGTAGLTVSLAEAQQRLGIVPGR
jgi:hypothetical protein